MMKITKVAIGLLLLQGITTVIANAQTNQNLSRTNVLLNLSLNLTAYEQTWVYPSTNIFIPNYVPTVKTDKVVTDGVIRAIAKRAQITGDLSNAKLYWRLSWSTNSDAVTGEIIVTDEIIIRRGAEDTVIDNSIFDLSFPQTVSTVRATLAGTLNSTEYANCNITLSSSQGSFFLQGIATKKSGSLFNGKSLIDRSLSPISFTASVAGSGSIGFHHAEWKGTVMASGQKVEIEEISP
jgi:hypothetical protein